MATLPAEADGRDLRSLLVGYHRDDKLVLAGGTGFTRETGHQLAAQLPKLKRAKPPFAAVPREYRRGVEWVDNRPPTRRRQGGNSPESGQSVP